MTKLTIGSDKKYYSNGTSWFMFENKGIKSHLSQASHENMTGSEKIKLLENQLENSRIENRLLKKYIPSSERAKPKSKDWHMGSLNYDLMMDLQQRFRFFNLP